VVDVFDNGLRAINICRTSLFVKGEVKPSFPYIKILRNVKYTYKV
jgi:hypothetical protein